MFPSYFTDRLFIFCIMLSRHVCCGDMSGDHDHDIIQPYVNHHGPTHGHRVIRECQPAAYGNNTFEEVAPHHSSSLTSNVAITKSRQFVHKTINGYWMESYVPGHHIVISDPDKTVSVLEPLRSGGCEDNIVATVADTARQRNCVVAINGGFFNTSSGSCYGNVISDSRMAHNSSGVQNVHFGIETDGSLFFGYLPPDVMLQSSFKQLIGGVIWLVRNGHNYVDVSKEAECSDSEETGSLQTFIDVQSARVAVGHDKQGKLVIVVVDGHSWESGMNLYQFADLLIELGVINAINLDGGGSATVIINGTLVNYPGDRCNVSNFMYSCQREVSTILCVHDIPCVPEECNNHGDCYHGHCQCSDHWTGPACDVLSCGATNCSGNGECTENGCLCLPGYQGADCFSECPLGYYGDQCRFMCNCSHGELCEPITGRCYCNAGYMGFQCETSCPYGYYGNDCKGVCNCRDGCSCHPVTGHCHLSPSLPTIWQVGHCVADKVIISRDKLVIDPDQYYLLLSCLIAVTIIALGSIVGNVVLLSYKFHHSLKDSAPKHGLPRCPGAPTLVDSGSCNDDGDIDSSPDEQSKAFFPKKRKQDREKRALWQTWRKIREKRSKGQEKEAANVKSSTTSRLAEQSHGPRVDFITSNGLQSNRQMPAEPTDKLLDEISLELSSHQVLSALNHNSSAVSKELLLESDDIFHEESVL